MAKLAKLVLNHHLPLIVYCFCDQQRFLKCPPLDYNSGPGENP